jgi:hypothetical protein
MASETIISLSDAVFDERVEKVGLMTFIVRCSNAKWIVVLDSRIFGCETVVSDKMRGDLVLSEAGVFQIIKNVRVPISTWSNDAPKCAVVKSMTNYGCSVSNRF